MIMNNRQIPDDRMIIVHLRPKSRNFVVESAVLTKTSREAKNPKSKTLLPSLCGALALAVVTSELPSRLSKNGGDAP